MGPALPFIVLGVVGAAALAAWQTRHASPAVSVPKALTSARSADLARAEAAGWLPVFAAAEAAAGLPAGILLAVASRETGVKNVVGDVGHGRGVFQIDDRSHSPWLAEHGAGLSGVPDVPAAATYAAGLLRSGLDSAKAQGVPESDRLKLALSAYNGGFTGALRAYRKGDSDGATTGRDYGRDVLHRWHDLGYTTPGAT